MPGVSTAGGSRLCPLLSFLPSAGSQHPFGTTLGVGHQVLDALHGRSSIKVLGDVALCRTHSYTCTHPFPPRGIFIMPQGVSLLAILYSLLSVHLCFVEHWSLVQTLRWFYTWASLTSFSNL